MVCLVIVMVTVTLTVGFHFHRRTRVPARDSDWTRRKQKSKRLPRIMLLKFCRKRLQGCPLKLLVL